MMSSMSTRSKSRLAARQEASSLILSSSTDPTPAPTETEEEDPGPPPLSPAPASYSPASPDSYSPASPESYSTARASSSSPVPGTSSAPSPPPLPDKCSICLADVVNRCTTDACRHEFCFGCLLEWSKVKAECPLCKQPIKVITHNIQNIDGRETHDEYHIPSNNHYYTPVPHLSIRLETNFGHGFGGFRRTNFEEYLDSIMRYTPGPDTFPMPTVSHARASTSRSRHSDRMDRFNRFHMREHPYLRILEVGPLPEQGALNAFVASAQDGLENPFYTTNNESRNELPQAFVQPTPVDGGQSYQRRRRIYDRSQYVAPFASTTLQAGTVFFPSVEYFRTHPTAYSRLKPWLKRELTVLLGLTTQRSSMAALYDLILSLLLRYDIRSREFREMISIYFTSTLRIKHFQHELYHFVLSGMRMEDYDATAEYSAGRDNRGDGSNSSNNGNESQSRPPLITIDDSDEQPQTTEAEAATSGNDDTAANPESNNGNQDEPSSSTSGSSSGLPMSVRRFIRDFSPSVGITNQLMREFGPKSASAGPSSRFLLPQEPQASSSVQKSDNQADDESDGDSDDDCQLLGIHPVVKPPPLAVITIDSDDDEAVPSQNDSSANANDNPSQVESSSVDPGISATGSTPINLIKVPNVVTVDDDSSSSSSSNMSMDVVDLVPPHYRDQRSRQQSASTASIDKARRLMLQAENNRYARFGRQKMDILLRLLEDVEKKKEEAKRKALADTTDSSDTDSEDESRPSNQETSLELSRKRQQAHEYWSNTKRQRTEAPRSFFTRTPPSRNRTSSIWPRLTSASFQIRSPMMSSFNSHESETDSATEREVQKILKTLRDKQAEANRSSSDDDDDDNDEPDTQAETNTNGLAKANDVSEKRDSDEEDDDNEKEKVETLRRIYYEQFPRSSDKEATRRSTSPALSTTSEESSSSASTDDTSGNNTEDSAGLNVKGPGPSSSSLSSAAAQAQLLYSEFPGNGMGEVLPSQTSNYENLLNDIEFGDYWHLQRSTTGLSTTEEEED